MNKSLRGANIDIINSHVKYEPLIFANYSTVADVDDYHCTMFLLSPVHCQPPVQDPQLFIRIFQFLCLQGCLKVMSVLQWDTL